MAAATFLSYQGNQGFSDKTADSRSEKQKVSQKASKRFKTKEGKEIRD